MNNAFNLRILLTCLAFAWMPAQAANNPFDYVGMSHNEYLDCLMTNGGDPKASPLKRVVEECAFDPGSSTEAFVERYSSLVDSDPTRSVAERMQPYRASYTDYQFSFFERIDAVLQLAETEEEANTLFVQLEEEAIANVGTRSSAGQSVFAALSTARHSLQYWSQASAPELAGGGMSSQRRKFWDVLLVVGADLLGAAGGTLIGGPVVGAGVGAASSNGAAAILKD